MNSGSPKGGSGKSWADILKGSSSPTTTSPKTVTSSPVTTPVDTSKTTSPPPPLVTPKPTAKPSPTKSTKPVTTCPSPSPLERGYPMGFDSKEQFEECMQSLCDKLSDMGISCSELGVRGSAATFQSNNPNKKGQYFDSRGKGKSDVDAFFVTDDRLKCYPSKVGFFHPDKVKAEYPDIDDWNDEWSKKLGRKIEAAAFKSSADALTEDYISYGCK